MSMLHKFNFSRDYSGSVSVYTTYRQLVGTVVWALLMTSLTSVPVVVLLDTEHQTWRRVLLDRM